MIRIHIGEGEGHEVYDWDRRRMLNVEYGAMERVTGLIGADLENAINKGGANAVTALIWVLRKRTHHRLRFEEVVYEAGELSFEILNDDGTPIGEVEDTGEEGAVEGDPAAPKASKKAGRKPN